MDQTTYRLAPPFSKENSLRSSTYAALPHNFRQNDQLLDPRKDTRAYLKTDLQTPRLSKIHRLLWLTGMPRPARPLHRQRLLLRTIHLTESTDEHLVWHETCIFIKPIPEYLLDYEFWDQELCADEALHKSACGLLLSYAWLVCYKSDLRIAGEAGLLPANIDWNAWTAFMMDFTSHIDTSTICQVDSRYSYSELRLSRLNTLYRFGAAGFSLRNVVYGFMSGSTRYTTFFERNFGWILAVFVYMSVVLSAMQVALATERFGDDIRFQQFSYGMALLSMAFVLAAVAIMFLVAAQRRARSRAG
ncbi:hypothetical protein CEP52_017300 [Fusarium oligoseptatum]|uniref:Uncharacterized protein n=1 Tax=Fusarium oligoseptatum TaxID=2604345 RepID=A0A428RTT2_9HYPO|nr:hypothetical protein CEP52_017300 [Fusarium oligoseptatum]